MNDKLYATDPTTNTPDPTKGTGGTPKDPDCCTAPGDGDPGPPKG